MMPNNEINNHEDETLYKIPFVEHEYAKYRASRRLNRITCALAVTNLAWFICVLVYILRKRYEKRR